MYLMRRHRVRQYELAVDAWIQATGRPVAGGTSHEVHEVVRRYRKSPPFWPLTINSDEPVLTGYAINAHAVVIRYAQRDIPMDGAADGFTSVRTEFGPGCRDLLGRASGQFRHSSARPSHRTRPKTWSPRSLSMPRCRRPSAAARSS